MGSLTILEICIHQNNDRQVIDVAHFKSPVANGTISEYDMQALTNISERKTNTHSNRAYL